MESCSFVDIKALLRFKKLLIIEVYKGFSEFELQDLILDYLRGVLGLVGSGIVDMERKLDDMCE